MVDCQRDVLAQNPLAYAANMVSLGSQYLNAMVAFFGIVEAASFVKVQISRNAQRSPAQRVARARLHYMPPH